MKSPVSPNKSLTRETLIDGLVVYRCPESQGIYLPAADYWRWLQQQPERLPALPAPSQGHPESHDNSNPKLCSEGSGLMLRYKVGKGSDFYIDRSPCGGIWLDSGEWDTLVQRQLHDELHLIFTTPWQNDVRHAELATAQRARLTERLGPDLAAKVEDLHQDLQNHPDLSFAIAYLSSPTSS